jgi:hypothetical protein
MGRGYEAVIDMSTASHRYDRSSLIDLNSKGYGSNAPRQRFALGRFLPITRGRNRPRADCLPANKSVPFSMLPINLGKIIPKATQERQGDVFRWLG